MPRYPAGYFSNEKQIEAAALRRALKKRGLDTDDMSDEDLWRRIEKVDKALQSVNVNILRLNEAIKALNPDFAYWLRD